LLTGDDLAARIGGEEFAVALPGVDLAGAEQFADRLRSAIAEQHLQDARPELAPITVSVGVTVARPGDSLDALLSRADNALYAAKRSGRNIVVASD
jgi:diguanylate cyclase (GGDEF)-like protein